MFISLPGKFGRAYRCFFSCAAAGALTGLLLAGCGTPEATPLTIAAASSLQPALGELLPRYAERCACSPRAVYGSSGKLTAQISAGAPYDVFLSAGSAYTDTLFARGAGTARPTPFASGRLVAWTLDTSFDLHYIPELRLPGQADQFRYAIPNPLTAPYGQAAETFFRRIDVWQAIQPQLVYGESVGQTAQFVLSGAARVGYVAAAIPLSLPPGERGRTRDIPETLLPPVIHTVLSVSPAGEDFRDFLATDEARVVLARWRYAPTDD